MKFGKLTVIGDSQNAGYVICRCECNTVKEVNKNHLISGRIRSCGCDRKRLITEAIMNKFRVENAGQLHLTPEQIEMTKTADNFKELLMKFDKKPTIYELTQVTGLSKSRLLVKIHSFGLESLVDIAPLQSRYEDELLKIFEGSVHSYKLPSGKEIDVYIPEAKVGIEFDGNYWHSELKKDRYYHMYKTMEAANNGIRLINIFEYEWNDESRKEKIIRHVKNIINTKKNIIYARKCDVAEISNDEAKLFLNEYHLQGGINAEINLGLKYEGNLIGVMTFGKPRFNYRDYEIYRLAYKDSVGVVGGSEKLLKYFINKYKPKGIVSYCDLAKFTGDTYLKMGFKNESVEPNYVWYSFSEQKVLTRYQTTKDKLVKLNSENVNKTEADIMHDLGYFRIYDCGVVRYTLDM